MKHAREMTETERDAALAELKRGPKKDMTEAEREEWLREHYPVLNRPPIKANDMTEAEREEWLREHKRRSER
jgi:hypothetical protein